MDSLPDSEFVSILRRKGLKDYAIRQLLNADYDSIETLRCMEQGDVDELGLTKQQCRLLLNIVGDLSKSPGSEASATETVRSHPDQEFFTFLKDKAVNIIEHLQTEVAKGAKQPSEADMGLDPKKTSSSNMEHPLGRRIPDSELDTFLSEKGVNEDTKFQLIAKGYDSVDKLQFMEHNAVANLNLSKPQSRMLSNIVRDLHIEGMKRPQKSQHPLKSQARGVKSPTAYQERLPDTKFVTFLRDKGIKDDTILKLLNEEYNDVKTLQHMAASDVEELKLQKQQSRLLLSVVANLEHKQGEFATKTYKLEAAQAASRVKPKKVSTPKDSQFRTFLRDQGAKDDTIQKMIDEEYDSVETLQHMEQDDIEELGLSKPQTRLVLKIIANLSNEGVHKSKYVEISRTTGVDKERKRKTLPDSDFVSFLRNKGAKDDTIQKMIDEDYDSVETLQHMEQGDIEELGLSKQQFRLVVNIMANLSTEEVRIPQKTTKDSEFVTFLRKKGLTNETIQLLLEEEYNSMEDLQHIEKQDVEELGLSKAQSRVLLSIMANSQQQSKAPIESKHNSEFVKYLLDKGAKDETIQKLLGDEYDSIETLQHMTQDDVEELGLSKAQTRLLLNVIANAQGEVAKTKSNVKNSKVSSQATSKKRINQPDTEYVTFLRDNGVKDDTIHKLLGEEYDSKEALRHMEQEDVEELELSKPQTRLLLNTISNLQTDTRGQQETVHSTKPKTSTTSATPVKTDDSEFLNLLRNKGIKESTIRKLVDDEYDSLQAFVGLDPSDLDSLQLTKAQSSLGRSNVESQAVSYDDLYKQGLRDLNLHEDTIGALLSNGFKSLEALKRLGKLDLDFMKLPSDQRKILEEWNVTETELPLAFKKLSKIDTQETGMGILYNYLHEMGAEDKPRHEEHINDKKMRIIKLPVMQDSEDNTGKVRRCIIGSALMKYEQKTIMVVGATGTGKSTLIDALVNYIFGTTWTDKHRIRLIDQHAEEVENASKGQSQSQTEWITIYTITCGKSSNIKFTLNLIDTPGFGDTRGIQRDQELVKQIEALFTSVKKYGLDSIEAVCFVAKAPDARLTASQKYIFNSVLSVFGKDIKGNIILMITFADGQKPAVLDAIEAAKLPYGKHFEFNNSALFADNGATSVVPHSFWDMSFNSFKMFFDFISELTPKSLTLTKKVLQKRGFLKDTVKYLDDQIQNGLNIMSILKKEQKIFEEHEQDVAANKNFTVETEETYQEKEYLTNGRNSNFCNSCDNTCHYECKAFNNFTKWFCEVFTWRGKCTRCRGKCSYTEHKMVDYKYVTKTRKVTTTLDHIKAKYQKAADCRDSQKSVVELNKELHQKYENEVNEDIKRCAKPCKN